MVSQLQLHGVGMKVILVLQVWLIIFAHVVIHEGDGYDERNQTLPIKFDDLQHFLFLIRRHLLLEITQYVLQNVGIFFRSRFQRQGFQEKTLIFFEQIFPGDSLPSGHQFAHDLIVFWAVREDEEAARASGVNTFRQKIIALAISTFFAGLSGGAFAFYHVSYYHDLPFNPTWTFDALLITFVGGVGTIAGPVIGSFFYAIFKELFVRTFPQLHVFIFGILFIFVVLLLPGGLVEMAARIRRLFAAKKALVSQSS